jgi:hypothetical protein
MWGRRWSCMMLKQCLSCPYLTKWNTDLMEYWWMFWYQFLLTRLKFWRCWLWSISTVTDGTVCIGWSITPRGLDVDKPNSCFSTGIRAQIARAELCISSRFELEIADSSSTLKEAIGTWSGAVNLNEDGKTDIQACSKDAIYIDGDSWILAVASGPWWYQDHFLVIKMFSLWRCKKLAVVQFRGWVLGV